MVEDTFKVILSNHQPSTTIITPKLYPQVPQPVTSYTSRDGNSTMSLIKLFQGLTILSANFFF